MSWGSDMNGGIARKEEKDEKALTWKSYYVQQEEEVTMWTWWKLLSRVWFFVTPGTIQSMEFSRPEYWSGWPFPSPEDLPNPGIKLRSPTLQVDSLPAEPPEKPYTVALTWWEKGKEVRHLWPHWRFKEQQKRSEDLQIKCHTADSIFIKISWVTVWILSCIGLTRKQTILVNISCQT